MSEQALDPPRSAVIERSPSRLVEPGRIRVPGARALAGVGIGGLLLTTLVTVLASGRTLILAPDSIRPLPAGLAGALDGLGFDLHLGGVIGIFAVMLASYGLVVAATARRRFSPRVVAGFVVALHVIVALGPPLLSTDLFSYGAYARMGEIYGINPYLRGPFAISPDIWFPYVGARWVYTPTAYGPLFTAASYALAPFGVGVSAAVYKWTALIAGLLVVVAIDRVARRRGLDRARALALVGLNPVLLVYALGGAHNDLLMLAALVGGVACADAGRWRSAGGLIVAATAIKVTAGVAIPFVLVARRSRRARRELIAGVGLAGAAICGLSFGLFGSGPLRLLGTLEVIQGHGGDQSIPGRIAQGLGWGAPGLLADHVLSVVAATAVVGLAVRVARGRLDWETATGWAFVVVLVTSAYLLPWYVVWVLPFAAVSRSRSLACAALVLTVIGMTSL